VSKGCWGGGRRERRATTQGGREMKKDRGIVVHLAETRPTDMLAQRARISKLKDRARFPHYPYYYYYYYHYYTTRSYIHTRIHTALHGNMSLQDLAEVDFCSAPPYSSANDPVNLVAFVGMNDCSGTCTQILEGECGLRAKAEGWVNSRNVDSNA